MQLKNLKLDLSAVNRNKNATEIEAVDVGTNRKRNADGSYSKEIDTFTISCAANRGDTLKVKVPPECSGKMAELSTLLRSDATVMVKFTNLKLFAYAMQTNGNLYSGVSGRADDFEISSKILADDFAPELEL